MGALKQRETIIEELDRIINDELRDLEPPDGLPGLTEVQIVTVCKKHLRPFIGNRYEIRFFPVPLGNGLNRMELGAYDWADLRNIDMGVLIGRIVEGSMG